MGKRGLEALEDAIFRLETELERFADTEAYDSGVRLPRREGYLKGLTIARRYIRQELRDRSMGK